MHAPLQRLAGVVVAIDGHRQIAADDLDHPLGRFGTAVFQPVEADADGALAPLWGDHRPEVEGGVVGGIDPGEGGQARGGHPPRGFLVGGGQHGAAGLGRDAELAILLDQDHRRRGEHAVQRLGGGQGDGAPVDGAGHGAGHALQRPRAVGGGAALQRLPPGLGRQRADDGRHQQQQGERPDVGGVGDAEGIARLHQEVVHRQDRRGGGGQRRPPAEADRRHHHRQDEDQRQVRDADLLVHDHRHDRGRGGHQDRQDVADPAGCLAGARDGVVIGLEAHLPIFCTACARRR